MPEGFHVERTGTNYMDVIDRYANKVKNPKSAIRAKCIECSGGSIKEVNECRVFNCALYPFRQGENPFHKKTQERLAREGNQPEEDENEDDTEAED